MKFALVTILAAAEVVLSLHLHAENTPLTGRSFLGQSATKGQFPYVVLIEIKYFSNNICGGAFIGSSWVLSAATCFFGAVSANVYLGVTDIDDAEVSYSIKAVDFVIHPEWTPAYKRHNIALVRIPRTDICMNIFPVPLPKLFEIPRPTFEDSVAVALGWGATHSHHIATTLQYTEMRILSNVACSMGLSNVDLNSKLCASKSPAETVADGAVGGPLVLEEGLLVGVMSERTSNDDVILFTRVSDYLQWIFTNTAILYTE